MIHRIHEMVWGPWLLVLFLGTGIFFTVKSGFFQIRKFPFWWKHTIGSIQEDEGEEKGEVTKFQTACTALAATIGTGNIAGVATALTAGGPGAIFWMWVSAGIGMMTGYAETMLGIRYRYRDRNGDWICGPMVYLERGLKLPVLGMLYSFLCIMVSLGMGSMVQSNSIAETLEYSFGIPPVPIGIVLTGTVLLVVLGGIARIAFVSERLIPISAGAYMLFSMVVIMSCYDQIPYIFQCIFQDAFRPVSAFSGVAGYQISKSLQYGISRGVFSNEAGLGSMAVLHGAAEDTTPEQQGMWAMFEVFFDTILICTMTAFVILCMTEGDAAGSGYDGAALTAFCFSKRLGLLGEYVVSGAMLIFAFATIIAWYYLGRQAAIYLAERLKERRSLYILQRILRGKVYTMLYLGAVFLGCLAKLETVWEFSDIWNGLMALPNIIAIIFLMKEVTVPGNAEEWALKYTRR